MTNAALNTAPTAGKKVRHPKMLTGDAVWKFMTGGKATVTIKNRATGNRATYRVIEKDDLFEVYVFTGNDNTVKSHYTLMGTMTEDGDWSPWTELGRVDLLIERIRQNPQGHWVDNKGGFMKRVRQSVQSGRGLSKAMNFRLNGAMRKYKVPACPKQLGLKAVIFPWTWNRILDQGSLPESVEVWHEGGCCHCNRKLTVPASIELGMGPDCAEDHGKLDIWRALNKKLGKDLESYAATLKN